MAAPSLASAPAARFAQGEDVTVLVTATADPDYLGNVSTAMAARLPGGRVIVAGAQWAGITMIHGDIRPTLIQALRDALEYRDCQTSPECAEWRVQYDKALAYLGAGE